MSEPTPRGPGLNRRQLLTSFGTLSALTAAGACTGSKPTGTAKPSSRSATTGRPSTSTPNTRFGPGDRPDPSKPEGAESISQIEHIVIYMQENHSYDNYFGMLPRGDGFTLRDGTPQNWNPDAKGRRHRVSHMSATCDRTNQASQTWNDTLDCVHEGTMDGFITAADQQGTGSMGYWDGRDLPFYYDLASEFALCDRWFASAPCQTLPNRRFLQAGTSMGLITTDVSEVLATPTAPNGVIWDRLNSHGISWKNYTFDLADIMVFPEFYTQNKNHVVNYSAFLKDCADDTLPQVSIISPGGRLYTEENPSDIQLGEALSASVISALTASAAWASTVLFFTYDEHGGYYDHVTPPPAMAPDAIAPRLKDGDYPGGFDRYGLRVPAMVISPFAKRDYVSHVVHDHTSILKFIETKFNLGAMTRRDANADDLLDCFDFDNVPYKEAREFEKPALDGIDISSCEPKTPLPPAMSTR